MSNNNDQLLAIICFVLYWLQMKLYDRLLAINCFVLYWLQMKLYDFANFVKWHLVPYEYATTY